MIRCLRDFLSRDLIESMQSVQPWGAQSDALDVLMNAHKAAPPLAIQEEGATWRFVFHDVAGGDFPDWCTERGIDATAQALKIFSLKRYTQYQGSCDQAHAVEMSLRWGDHS